MKHSTLMDTDDLEPIIKPKEIDFDTLSIEELKEYIKELNAEIKRAENYISSKGKDRLNAESLFKK
jgi:uncharacterized small protein (DUF1192 family)